MKKYFTKLSCCVFAYAVLLLYVQPSWSRLVFTLPGTLASSVNALHVGDTLLLKNGVHQIKSIRVETDSVAILGEPGAIIRGDRTGQVLKILGNHVSIGGITVEGSGTNPVESDAAIAVYALNARIFDCKFQDYCHGIYLERAHFATITNNRFTGRNDRPERENGNAIHLYLTNGATITANEFHGGLDGVYFDVCDGGKTVANRATTVRYGVHYMNSRNQVCANNRVSESFVGVAVMYAASVVVSGNYLHDNLRANAYGILLQDIESCTVSGNNVIANEAGFLIENVRASVLSQNRVERNRTAMELFSNCSKTEVVQNDFIANSVALKTKTITREPRFTTKFFNNYWSTLNRVDFDDDGIVDLPMRIDEPFEQLLGEQPLLRLLQGTPAHYLWNTIGLLQTKAVHIIDPKPQRWEVTSLSLKMNRHDSHIFTTILTLLISATLLLCLMKHSRR
ncbi:MAG: right-handed parallel beta-helix repeat-containing protein [bacterium]|nr:right-handed parallel beta-helix repeat-containing protein [bacterium]